MIDHLLRSLRDGPPAYQIIVVVIAIVALAIMALLLTLEGRHFRKLALGSAWLKLRLASLPIVALAVAAIIGTISAVGISGMEALAVAYLALFTVGPLVYFGLHGLLGRMLGLSRGQSAWIGFSGLILLGVIPAVGQTMMPFVPTLNQMLEARADRAIPAVPSPFTVARAQRLHLPNDEQVWAIHYQAPAGVSLMRVDMEFGKEWSQDVLRMSIATLCRRNNDLHLHWPADRPLQALRLFWKGADGKDYQSDWMPPPPAGEVAAFNVVWNETTATLPVALPRDSLTLAWDRPDRNPVIDSLKDMQHQGECVPQTLELPERYELGRPQTIRLRTDHALPKGPTWADFRRSDAGTGKND